MRTPSMKQTLLTTSLLISFIFIGTTHAQWDFKPDGASLGIGIENDGKKDILSYRSSLLWDINYNMFEIGDWHMSSYLDTSINYWKSRVSSAEKIGIKSNSSLFAIAVSPIFRFSPNQQYGKFSPYIEAGIGLGFTSHASLHGEKNSRIDLGNAVTFESRLAVGMMYGQNWDLSARWYHYANGTFNKNHKDLDFFGVSLSYWF